MTASEDGDRTSAVLTLVEHKHIPIPTAWEEFFDQKKAEFVSGVRTIAENRSKSPMKALKNFFGKLFGQKAHTKAGEQVLTIDEAFEQVTDLGSFRSEVLTLIEQFSTKKNKHDSNWIQRQTNRLLRGAARIKQFHSGVSSAVQCDPTGAATLFWGIILIVVQFSCLYAESTEMFSQVLDTLSHVHEVLPSLETDFTIHDWDPDLSKLLLAIYDCYIQICIAAIEYSTKLNHPFHFTRVSTKPEKKMNSLKTQIEQHIESFDRRTRQAGRQAVKDVGKGLQQVANDHEENSRQRHETTLSAIHEVKEEVHLTLINTFQGMTLRTPEISREVHFPIQSLIMPRNDDFTGREGILAELHSRLISANRNSDKPGACCLRGIGGMGKTEIALEFAYRHLSHWEAGVFWVAADMNQETELLRTFYEIGSALGKVSSDELDDRNIFKVKTWLQETDKNWLMVFDGFMPGAQSAEWRQKLDRIWPFKTNAVGCAIIVTTQAQIHSRYVGEVIHIEPLADDQGLRLLLNKAELEQLTEPERDTALEISRELGGSALFLKLAREYKDNLELSLTQYLNLIRSNIDLPLANANIISNHWRYPKAAYKVLELTLNHLDTDARDLLDVLAFMYHEDISQFLFVKQPQPNPDSERRFLDSIYKLKDFGLIRFPVSHAQKKHKSLRIHRAIQVALLVGLNNNLQRREAAFKRATQYLRASYPAPSPLQIPNAIASATLRLVLPHVLNIVTSFEKAVPKLMGDLELARLVIDVGGMDCYDRGLINESYRLNGAAMAILDQLVEPTVESLLSDVFVMQGLCTDFMALSKREEGLTVRRQALEIRQRLFKAIPKDRVSQSDEIRLYNCYTDLSCSLQQINDFAGVKDLLTKSLEMYQKWGSEAEEPFEYSKYYSQFAYVLLYESRTDEAVEYAEKAYKLAERSSSGTNYPWLYKFDYANILWQHGKRKQEAFELLQILIKDHSQELSSSYSEILNLSMEQNLGIMAYFLGYLNFSESRLRDLAKRTSQCPAWPNENLIRGNYYLSQVLKDKQSTHIEGVSLEQDAIKDLTEMLKNNTRDRADLRAGNHPMLFDYIVHWEFRLITPRQPLPAN